MKYFRLAVSSGICALLGLLIIASPHNTYAQQTKAVQVTNDTTNPVPTKNVENPARNAFQVAFELLGSNPATVPAGKIFVIEHISGAIRVESQFNAPVPCRIRQLSISTGSLHPIDVIPIYMGTGQGLNGDVNFFSISQPVRVAARPGSELGGASMSLGQYCNSFPLMWSNIVFTGYLVDAN